MVSLRYLLGASCLGAGTFFVQRVSGGLFGLCFLDRFLESSVFTYHGQFLLDSCDLYFFARVCRCILRDYCVCVSWTYILVFAHSDCSNVLADVLT